MTLRRGEIVLIRMQFHQAPGSKVRPALILLDAGDDDFVAAPITSRPHSSEYDLQIEDWPFAGLNVASYIRVDKLTVLAKVEVVRSLGFLSVSDRELLDAVLCRTIAEIKSHIRLVNLKKQAEIAESARYNRALYQKMAA